MVLYYCVLIFSILGCLFLIGWGIFNFFHSFYEPGVVQFIMGFMGFVFVCIFYSGEYGNWKVIDGVRYEVIVKDKTEHVFFTDFIEADGNVVEFIDVNGIKMTVPFEKCEIKDRKKVR